MKALEMMIQLSAGMNFDAGNMLIGPHTPNKSSSNLNDGRLILLLWESPVCRDEEVTA